MATVIIIIFITGYLFIAFEHVSNVNKTAAALVTGVLCWTLLVFSEPSAALIESNLFNTAIQMISIEEGTGFLSLSKADQFKEFVLFELNHHLSAIAQIILFLLGAMTIVELVDAHHGFRFITDRIRTRDPRALLWIIGLVSFFLSAILDNLTTSIVMVSLIRKLVHEKERRMVFAGVIIIAANAGGAWTPIGDITTTMLWIGGQISALNIMKSLFLPSLVCLVVPLVYLSFRLKGTLGHGSGTHDTSAVTGSRRILFIGVGALVSVPVFKTYTHLPPYMGMLLGLGILWIVSELIHPELDEATKKKFTVAGALSRVDVPSVLFFAGILLAVAALETMLTLQQFAGFLARTLEDDRIIITLIGVLSAVVDNVPLVAASMGMYSLSDYPQDHMIWEYLAYCAGTGGSMLIIGSAAGVAVMGMEKINFIWYARRIALVAMSGYLAGAIVYLVLESTVPG